MNKRQSLTDASSEREAYSAPNYERFTFETSGLVQTSEGNLGNQVDGSTAVAAGLINSDW